MTAAIRQLLVVPFDGPSQTAGQIGLSYVFRRQRVL
jgi:hypothetical protein